MARAVPPAAEGRGTDGRDGDERPRCPRCGSGDLFATEVARRDGGVARAAYCAGLYDRDRRRFLRRSCGYSGLLEVACSEDRRAASNSSPAFQRGRSGVCATV